MGIKPPGFGAANRWVVETFNDFKTFEENQNGQPVSIVEEEFEEDMEVNLAAQIS